MSEKSLRLRAQVREWTGKTRHSIGTIEEGLPVPIENIPAPDWVEIVEGEGLFYLLYYDRLGKNIADTCHLSLEEAQEQAAFEFRIDSSDWIKLHEE